MAVYSCEYTGTKRVMLFKDFLLKQSTVGLDWKDVRPDLVVSSVTKPMKYE